MKKVVWLTGRSGSGKSSVAGILKKYGYEVIDADKISREILMPGKPAYNETVESFGREVLYSNGRINRKLLGKVVFGNKVKLSVLNEITHKYIYEEFRKRIAKSNGKLVFIDAALLPDERIYDVIVLVSADNDVRVQRIMKRDKITKEEALSRLNSQKDEADYKKASDYIIENSGTRKMLAEKVLTFLECMNN